MEDQGSGGLSGSKDTKKAEIWECSDCMCDCLPHVFRPVEARRGWLDLLRLEPQTPTMWVWEPNPRALQEQPVPTLKVALQSQGTFFFKVRKSIL